MKLAVFADIHSNYHAFTACLADARAKGAEGFVLLGDFVSDLPYPWKTMDLVYTLEEEYPCWCVRGNREDYMLQAWDRSHNFVPGSKSGSLLYTFQNLRAKDLAFFASLPISCTISPEGYSIELAHAEMDNNRHVISENDPYLQTLCDAMHTKLLLVGHSHRQYLYRKNGKTILNPGSLGIPQGKPGLAQYAMVELLGGEAQCELCAAAYDVPAVIREQFCSGLADMAPFWARSILNNLVSGENSMLHLLHRIEARDGFADEEVWHQEARVLKLALTEEELLLRWQNRNTQEESI